MDAVNAQKINSLIESIDEMIRQLNKHSSLETRQRVNESFYLEKIVELRLLGNQLEQARQHFELIQMRVNEHYKNVYCQWKNDASWLSVYIGNTPIL